MPRLLVVLLSALSLGACTVIPINQQTVQGRYEMVGKPGGSWFAGEALELHDGTFQYWLYTDLADDPRLARFPVSGRFTVEGTTLTLHHPAVLFPERSITRDHKKFMLWTARQREAFRDTHIVPGDVLLQK